MNLSINEYIDLFENKIDTLVLEKVINQGAYGVVYKVSFKDHPD